MKKVDRSQGNFQLITLFMLLARLKLPRKRFNKRSFFNYLHEMNIYGCDLRLIMEDCDFFLFTHALVKQMLRECTCLLRNAIFRLINHRLQQDNVSKIFLVKIIFLSIFTDLKFLKFF